MTLREPVVEAMAQAAYASQFPSGSDVVPGMAWQTMGPSAKAYWVALAEAALDAALDVLGEYWDDDWRPGSVREADSYSILRMVEGLRAGKGSDE